MSKNLILGQSIIQSISMSQNGERNGDCHTENTDYSYTLDRQDPPQFPNINKIIQSTEEIINSQAIKIFDLINQIKTLKRENEGLKAKYQTIVKAQNGNSESSIDNFVNKIHELEVQLISTKTQLALLKEQSLEIQFANMKSSRNCRNSYFEKREDLVGFPEIEKMVNGLVSKIEHAENDSNKQQWLKNIEIFLASYPRIDKFKQKTFQLVKKGIPSDLRERLWPIIFTNKLGITSTLYGELLNRIKKDESYSKKVLTQINKDIVRSFNGKTQFDQKIGLVSQVTELLEVFHVFRPDVSYVQGMTYPAIVLTLIVGKNKAFEIFCNLVLSNEFFRRLYTFESNYLTCYCRAFDLLLQEKQPKLAKTLLERNIQSQIYLVEWFYTFFSRGLSYEFTLKIWDYLAFEEQLLFFKLGLCILEMLEEPIMESNCEQSITIIRQFGNHVTESKLLQCYGSQKLNEEKMLKVLDKIFKKLCLTK